MVLGAQNPGRIVDLHHLVVFISPTTSVDIDHRRVFVDDLWGLIYDLWRLVSWRHELHMRVIEKSLGRSIELGDHLPGRLSEERQIPFVVFVPDIVRKGLDALVVILSADLPELG